jgi:hypothetical protein
MASVVAVNLTIDKGTTFEESFFFTNDDGTPLIVTNELITAKLKKHPSSKTSFPFTVNFVEEEDAIVISMASTITSSLPSGRCVYDIIFNNNNGKIKKLVEGNVIVKDSVST